MIVRLRYLAGSLERREREKQGQWARQMRGESNGAGDAETMKYKQKQLNIPLYSYCQTQAISIYHQ